MSTRLGDVLATAREQGARVTTDPEPTLTYKGALTIIELAISDLDCGS